MSLKLNRRMWLRGAAGFTLALPFLPSLLGNDKAYAAVYGGEKSTSFFSERMDAQNCGGVHPVYKNDWLLFCKKG